MGGEHLVSFHGGEPCSMIHPPKKGESFKNLSTEEDQTKWISVKQDILTFLAKTIEMEKKNSDQAKLLEKRYQDISMINDVRKAGVYWSARICSGTFGNVMHDIAHLLMISFPGKICGYYERCHSARLIGRHFDNVDSWFYDGTSFSFSEKTDYEFVLYGKI